MTQTLVEVLLLVPAALCAGFVIFLAGVIQGIMEERRKLQIANILRATLSLASVVLMVIGFV